MKAVFVVLILAPVAAASFYASYHTANYLIETRKMAERCLP